MVSSSQRTLTVGASSCRTWGCLLTNVLMLQALLLAVCTVLLQPLAGNGIVALALIVIAWWAVVRSVPAQVQG